MFLRILALKPDGMITNFLRRKEIVEVGTQMKDNRGKAASNNKLDKDLFWKNMMSYHLQISHYKSQNASNKQYLEPRLTITAM